ncbi:MAG: SDR family NAD(P)-dependent oxidoreductase [Candidatus Heimdallarchaeota archaeon]|nr:SDR family NAD(P)-dependent oxidoreductase [Candidatus Heimdallarchaeota archaeon]
MHRWNINSIGDLSSKVFIVTGANSGIGFETSKILSDHGAEVILAGRNKDRLLDAQKDIGQDNTSILELDLASLDSIKTFVGKIRSQYDQIDVLINNAGLMDLPRMETENGFEMVMGINHFGTFALTIQLLPLILESKNSRVVTTSSLMHWVGNIKLDDINSNKHFSKTGVYAMSKLANLLFAFELDRRLENYSTKSIACHPGYARTELQFSTNKQYSKYKYYLYKFVGNPFLGQSAYRGALSTVYAATQDIPGGSYVGPRFLFRGDPRLVRSSKHANNKELGRELWYLSESLTKVNFP